MPWAPVPPMTAIFFKLAILSTCVWLYRWIQCCIKGYDDALKLETSDWGSLKLLYSYMVESKGFYRFIRSRPGIRNQPDCQWQTFALCSKYWLSTNLVDTHCRDWWLIIKMRWSIPWMSCLYGGDITMDMIIINSYFGIQSVMERITINLDMILLYHLNI